MEYVHRELGQDVTSIAGHYRLVREARRAVGGRDLLVVVGHAAYDTACCGPGGCAYVLVPGFVQSWKSGTNSEGLAVSLVEPIRDDGVRGELQLRLRKEEKVQQVQFL